MQKLFNLFKIFFIVRIIELFRPEVVYLQSWWISALQGCMLTTICSLEVGFSRFHLCVGICGRLQLLDFLLLFESELGLSVKADFGYLHMMLSDRSKFDQYVLVSGPITWFGHGDAARVVYLGWEWPGGVHLSPDLVEVRDFLFLDQLAC